MINSYPFLNRFLLSGWLLILLFFTGMKPVFAQTPTITGVLPAHAAPGCQVKISGTNLSGASVYFGGVAGSWVSGTSTEFTATVPANAVTGVVSVVTAGGSASSSSSFTVVKPAISAGGTITFCGSGSVQLTATSLSNPAGSALNFDGTGNYVNVPNFSFNTNGGPVTIEFWTKASGGPVGSRSLFAIATSDGQRFQAHVPSTGSVHSLHFDYGNFSSNGRITANYNNYVDKWTHVALVSAGKGGFLKAIYINGVEVTKVTTASDGASTTGTTGLTIGKWDNLYHKGAVDEFRIWNKVRTQAEIQASMNSSLNGPQANLKGYWKFDEATGTTTADASGNNFTGTLLKGAATSLPTWQTPTWADPTFSWSPATGLNTTSGTSVTASPTGSTTYTVTATYPSGCTATATTDITINPQPLISSFSPAKGNAGGTVTLTGTGFNTVNAVKFGTINAASFQVVSNTEIKALVPAGVSTGKIQVSTTDGCTTLSSANFTLSPEISAFTPGVGIAGCQVEITGIDFTNASAVTFNGVAATAFTVNSATRIMATVPAGSGTGLISVTTPVGTATSTSSFSYAAVPSVSPSGPVLLCPGSSVTLTASGNLVNPVWSNGQTGSAITVSAGGNYSVTCTYGTGCAVTSNVVPVTESTLARPVITASGATSICQGGSVTLSAPPTEPFNAGTGFSAPGVQRLAVQPDGKLVVTGIYSTFNGVSQRNIIRLNANGSKDTGFNVGSGFNNNTIPVVVQPDGKVLAGGAFSAYNGVTRNHFARLLSDGTLETAFAPSFNGYVIAIALQPDKKILVGGQFSTLNGASKNRIVRLNADGSADASFNIGSGFNAEVSWILVQPDGKILVAGSFTSYNGTNCSRLVRLSTTGVLETSFNPAFNDQVGVLALQPDGKILADGNFTTVNGASRPGIVRLLSNGTLDPDFSTVTATYSFPYSRKVITLQANGKILIAGDFTAINGVARNRIARLLSDGTLDTSFDPGPGFDNMVSDLVLTSSEDMVAVGWFSNYNGSAQNKIAKIRPDGGLYTSMSGVTYAWSNGQTGNSITVQASGQYTVTATDQNGCSRTSLPVTVKANQAGTWLGTVSSDWENAANWCGGVPTSASNVVIPADAPRMPEISGASNQLEVSELQIENGAALTLTNGMLTVYGNLTCDGNLNLADGSYLMLMKNFTCPGTFNHTGGYIDFTSFDPYSVPALTYHNLKLHGNRTLTGNVIVKNQLILSRDVHTNGFNFSVGGDLQIEGPVSGSGKIILEQGNSMHKIIAFYPQLPNLEINDPLGAQLQSNLTLTGNLKLTQGIFDLSTYSLTLNGTVSGESNASYLKGTVIKTVAVNGSGIYNFGNLGLEFDNVGGGNWGNVKVSRITGSAVRNATDESKKSINRRWNIEPEVQTGLPVNLTLKWLAADDNGLLFPGSEARVWKSTDNGQKWFAADVLKPISYNGDWRTMTVQTKSFSFWTVADQNNPLPVSWLYFKGKPAAAGNELYWATATEENSKEFVVERSGTGREFKTIGWIKAAGNSSLQHTYTFTDQNATVSAEKVHYYRLKQTDWDGSFTYSPVIVLSLENYKSTEPEIWPNPFTNYLEVSLPEAGNTEITLTALTGQVISRKAIASGPISGIRLDNLNEVRPGLYLLQIRCGNKVAVYKVVKQ